MTKNVFIGEEREDGTLFTLNKVLCDTTNHVLYIILPKVYTRLRGKLVL